MIEAGLFDRFPVESVFGMHNIPGMPVGTFAIKPGPMMAAFDIFKVKVKGKGGHAAMPQFTVDPIIVGNCESIHRPPTTCGIKYYPVSRW